MNPDEDGTRASRARRLLTLAALAAGAAALVLAALAWRAQRAANGPETLSLPPSQPVAPAPRPAIRSSPPAEVRTLPPGIPGDRRPGRAAPSEAPEALVYDIAWHDQADHQYRSRIVIHAGPGLRVPAEVVTSEAGGDELVRYQGSAFRDTDGRIHIDARGATISGAFSAEWSPDSFAISSDGAVSIQDDQHSPSDGWVVQTTKVE